MWKCHFDGKLLPWDGLYGSGQLSLGHYGSSGTSKSTCCIVKALSRQKAIVKRETVKSGKVILMGGRCLEIAYIGVVSYP
jgi:hypothetical protein